MIPCIHRNANGDLCGKDLFDEVHEYSETADHIYRPDRDALREANQRIWGQGR